MHRKINLPVYRIAKEAVALLGIVELILATIIGFRFGEGSYCQAWLLTGVLALIAYSSTRLWIWVMERMVNGKHRGT